MNIRFCGFLILFLVGIFRLSCADNLAYRSYGVGLSNNTIRGIEEDKYGFLWIATEEGLNRVCGSQVQCFYKSDNGAGLSGNELNCLLNDSERSTMWIGTQRAGLVALNYDTGEFTIYRHQSGYPESLVTDDITDLAFDAEGNLWVATYSNGIECMNIETGEFTHHKAENVPGLANNEFWTVACDPKTGCVFGGHVDSGMSVIFPGGQKAKTYNAESGMPGNVVWDLTVDNDYVWLATDQGLGRYKISTEEFAKFTPPNFGFAYNCRNIKDLGGEILVLMDNKGVVSFDKQNHEFHEVDPMFAAGPGENPEFLSRSKPNRIFKDLSGNIIVGTLHEGLFAFSHDTSSFLLLNCHGEQYGGADLSWLPDVVTVAVTGNDDVWLGTNGNGLVGKRSLKTGDKYIVASLADENDNLWVVTQDGDLIEIAPAKGLLRRFQAILPGGHMVSLAVGGDSLWIGTSEGVFLFDKRSGKVRRRFDFERNFIFCVETDRKGYLWVGSYGDGVSVFDSEGNIIRAYDSRGGLPSNTVNDICEVDGDIWLATGEGVVRINGDNYDDFTVETGFRRSVKSIIGDSSGNVWYATERGVGVVKKDGGEMFFDRQLPISGFNVGSVARSRSGRIYFGATHGTLTFMPDYILSGDWLPMPVISGFVANGSSGDSDKRFNVARNHSVDLVYDLNNFTITVNPSDIFYDNCEFEYRMKGLDDKWYPMEEGRKITFRGLPYGSYEFEARNAGDDACRKTVSLKICISPPLWLTWWAMALYFAIAAAAVYYMFVRYKRRVRRQSEDTLEESRKVNMKELNEERMKFFTNITHELRTPLTLITGPLEDMIKAGSLSDTDRWKMQVIHKNAQRLLELVNQLLDFRKTESRNKRLCVSRGNIVAAVNEVALKYVELNRNPKVVITASSSHDNIVVYFDKEVLTIILDNIISNAVKYTEFGMISIYVTTEIRESREMVKIEVKDTGHGISKEALPYIFDRYYQEKHIHQASGTGIGLALVKSLVDLHHGEISVDSVKDVGTNLSIVFDRNDTYPEAMHEDRAEAACDSSVGAAVFNSVGNEDDEAFPSQVKVLLVEDNPDILDYAEKSLSGIFEVRTATNGRDGIEIARSEVPDVIVTDIMMPVMDGMEMIKLLRNDVATSHIPVVVLTAKDSMADREDGYNLGVESYLTKPFNASLLISRINNIVSRRHMIIEYLKSKGTESPDVPVHADEGLNMDRAKLEMSLGRIDREFLEKIDGIILDEESSDKVSIDFLTDIMCMSRATLYRKVKAITGMSTNEYIRYVKMTKAKELILESGLPLSVIADKLGFNSLGYFRESYKAVFGVTPTEFIKKLKG